LELVKDKVVFVNAIRVFGGADKYLHSFLTSALVEVSGELHNPTALTSSGERAANTPSGAQRRTGRFGEEKNQLPIWGIE